MGHGVPWGGTISGSLCKVESVAVFVEVNLHRTAVVSDDVDDVLLFLGAEPPLAVLVAVIGALAAEVPGEVHPDLVLRLARAYIFIYGVQSVRHPDGLCLLVVLALPVVQGAGQHGWPVGHVGWCLEASLSSEAVAGHRALFVHAYRPPGGNL